MPGHSRQSQEFPNFHWLHEFLTNDEFSAADWKSGVLPGMAYLRRERQRLKGRLTFFCLDLLVFSLTILHKDYRVCLQPSALWSLVKDNIYVWCAVCSDKFCAVIGIWAVQQWCGYLLREPVWCWEQKSRIFFTVIQCMPSVLICWLLFPCAEG